jgi:hypothetical protein
VAIQYEICKGKLVSFPTQKKTTYQYSGFQTYFVEIGNGIGNVWSFRFGFFFGPFLIAKFFFHDSLKTTQAQARSG